MSNLILYALLKCKCILYEYTSKNEFPTTGNSFNLYVDISNKNIYVWDESQNQYIKVSNGNLSDYYSKDEIQVLFDQISIKKLDIAENEFSSSYQLIIDNKAIGDKINIPKDLVVQSGSVKTVEIENNPINGYKIGDKYIDLLIANSNDEHIYILVSDLIDGVGEYYFVNNIKKGEIFNDYETNIASGKYSHAEGSNCVASDDSSHAEGYGCIASGTDSHAEGYQTQAIGYACHSEGSLTIANGQNSHAEGCSTQATTFSSHAEGDSTEASGYASHAEGWGSVAKADCSHASGYYTIANGDAQTAIGKYNIEDTENKYVVIIGNGIEDTNRKNLLTLSWNGSLVIDNIKTALDTTLVEGLKYQLDVLTSDITLTLPETANNDIEVDFAISNTIYNVNCDYLSLNVVPNTYYQVIFSYDKALNTWFASVVSSDYAPVSTTTAEVKNNETD